MADWPSHQSLNRNGAGSVSTSSSLNPVTLNAVSTAWPTANLAIFVPFRLSEPSTFYKMIIGAGTTATGNFDVGVYDVNGNRLVSSGATAKGASTEHVLDITDITIGPGLYYMALSADGTNNYALSTLTGTAPIGLQRVRLLGMLQMAAAYPLPVTATFAARTGVAVVPWIQLLSRPH